MMYLHEDRELFENVVASASVCLNVPESVVEKDYYVTMILKELSDKTDCVFKGGTSLSKCYHVIDRFSEDIDICFSEKLTDSQRKNLKNNIIASVSDRLGLPISNWDKTRSRRDYNCYTFEYDSLNENDLKLIKPTVMMEVSLISQSFPTVTLAVDSYVRQFLEKDNAVLIERYNLGIFSMKVQSLERTFIDKVFAVCDYHIQKNYDKHSRHIYDLYMLFPKISFDKSFEKLVKEVCEIRSKSETCPSAKDGVDVSSILREIVSDEVYRDDYEDITTYFENHPLDYNEAISVLVKIADKRFF